ncbi:hypothetical protein PCASD_15925 [Puccinia coronata f. sp. avenae]|uniref:Uncharacterized protein n=1 Tax=Puccinia coronata f. sp. avenae TaxID=200324 RepID=A0A2N5UEX6_9BASI|nr:hypothetical protein PCASD_15925 [Puccinia coronata f. sp. avenae]
MDVALVSGTQGWIAWVSTKDLAPDVYNAVMKLSASLSDILGGMFAKLSDVAFKDDQALMRFL